MIKFNNNFDLITFKHLLFNYFEQNYMYIINEVRRHVDSRVIVALLRYHIKVVFSLGFGGMRK